MKLLYCTKCEDVVRLYPRLVRTCCCGNVGGEYLDEFNAEYWGETAVPLGFNNWSFVQAMMDQTDDGWGRDYAAFVIPRQCETFRRVPCRKIAATRRRVVKRKVSDECACLIVTAAALSSSA